MKRFLTKVLKATLFFFSLVVGVYFILHYITVKTNSYDKNCVFVWGDSQMYQGLDVSLLGGKLGKQVLTSARHGAGVYDFLVSVKNVPDRAVSIVSLSEAAFFRNPKSDNNRTGFELSCLEKIHQVGCPTEECLRISNLNSGNVYYKVFGNFHYLYPYSNSLVYPEPLPLWHSLFEEPKDWFSWKAKAYIAGIQSLYDKHSLIVLIQFPFDEQVESFAKNSINRQLSDSLKFEIIGRFSMKYDTIVLHNDSLLMHDLSHMNKIGARMLTQQIADSLRKDTNNNRFFTVVIE